MPAVEDMVWNSAAAHWIRCATDGFDFVADFGATSCRCGPSGTCWESPRRGQQIRVTSTTRTSPSPTRPDIDDSTDTIAQFADYIEWRADHPSRRPDDRSAQRSEVDDSPTAPGALERTEVLAYTAMVAGRGSKDDRVYRDPWASCWASIRAAARTGRRPGPDPSAPSRTLRYDRRPRCRLRYVARRRTSTAVPSREAHTCCCSTVPRTTTAT